MKAMHLASVMNRSNQNERNALDGVKGDSNQKRKLTSERSWGSKRLNSSKWLGKQKKRTGKVIVFEWKLKEERVPGEK